MSKFTIAMVILVITIMGVLFFLEVPYENNYKAQMGDTAIIQYTVVDEAGNPISAESTERTQMVLGSDTMPIEFEAALVGMQRQEVKDVTITYPSDYYMPELANQTRTYTVTMLDIEKCIGSLEACGATAEAMRQGEITEEDTAEETE